MFILEWLEIAVSWILVAFHSALSLVFLPNSGWAWGLSIVGLVVVIRILLIPLFVKQIKAQRNMQLIQPKIKEIQKKYAGDREKQSQEMMKLYKETGTNPLASCLPIILQAPIFFALFRVLQGIAMDNPKGVLTQQLVDDAREANIFGVPIYATFTHAHEVAAQNPGVSALTIQIVTMMMIILMSATTFITQRQLIVKNTASDNPMVKQQKILLYVFPLVFAVGGINFPIGVLLYWLTTNIWSMGQQFWVIRNNPAPGTPAHAHWKQRQDAKEARKAAKKQPRPAAQAPADSEAGGAPAAGPPAPPARNQPRRQSRSKRQTGPKKAGRPTPPPSTGDQASGQQEPPGADSG